jgi:putative ABC transport system substrate-binding protein
MSAWSFYRCVRLLSAAAVLVCGAALWLPGSALAEPSVVVLGAQTKAAHRDFVEGFKRYLSKQRQDVSFVDLALGDDAGDTAGLSAIIREKKVPLVLTLGPQAFQLALQQEIDRPLIAGLTPSAGELESRANASGVVLEYGVETQLTWIKRILPEFKTIGVLYNPEQSGQRVAAARKAAARLGLRFVAQEVNSPSELPVAMESLFRRVDVLWGITDPVVLSRQTAKAILLTSFRNKVPFIAPSAAWVKAGALYSLEFDFDDMGAQSGEMANGVLKGRKISSMPPQEPRKVRYSLNLRTAEHMRLKFRGDIVDGAVQVFE